MIAYSEPREQDVEILVTYICLSCPNRLPDNSDHGEDSINSIFTVITYGEGVRVQTRPKPNIVGNVEWCPSDWSSEDMRWTMKLDDFITNGRFKVTIVCTKDIAAVENILIGECEAVVEDAKGYGDVFGDGFQEGGSALELQIEVPGKNGSLGVFLNLKLLVRPVFTLPLHSVAGGSHTLFSRRSSVQHENHHHHHQNHRKSSDKITPPSPISNNVSLRMHRDLLIAREAEIAELKDNNSSLKTTVDTLQSELSAISAENMRLRIQMDRELAAKDKLLAAKDRELEALKRLEQEKEQELCVKEQVMIAQWLREQLNALSSTSSSATDRAKSSSSPSRPMKALADPGI